MAERKAVIIKKDGVFFKEFNSLMDAVIGINLSRNSILRMIHYNVSIYGYTAYFKKGEIK